MFLEMQSAIGDSPFSYMISSMMKLSGKLQQPGMEPLLGQTIAGLYFQRSLDLMSPLVNALECISCHSHDESVGQK